MYNYPGAPGYSRAPSYGSAPPGVGAPGMGPPGGAPPGVAPPGVALGQGPPTLGGPRPLPQGWQAPTTMPNFNFNAPVIRLGTGGAKGGAMDSPVGGRRDNAMPGARRGLGMDRDGGRNEVQQVFPLTREEIARTVFVGNIPDGVGGDEGMERLLAAAGKLARWTRATDANNKPQTFGFAEFTDAEGLETAAEIFQHVHVPTKRQKPGEVKKEEDEEVETTKLQFVVDEASIKYAEEWSRTRNDDDATIQFRLDNAREELSQVIASFFKPPNMPAMEYGGDIAMLDAPTQDGENVEVAFVNLTTGEDELADIPAEMREIVAAEIAAFRDRSNQRDRERLRREEEVEAEERRRSGRRTSPPPSAPTGPGGTNGIPLGPRAERGIQGAPSGPKGSQFPRDYQGGVNFVNGGAINGGVYINREDDDDSASDSEIERRRKKKRDEELDDAYQKQLSRWLKLESRTVSSLGRSSDRVKNQEAEQQAARDAQAKQLTEFDDDHEASSKRHIYYRDHGEYMREREKVREREAKDDAVDRQQEQRELAAQSRQREHARGQADAFLDQQAEELMRTQEQREPAAQFKISLGAAAKKLEQTAAPRRTAADVENLLEDEEPTDHADKKRTLKLIKYDTAIRANLTEEEKEEAVKQLAREIPTSNNLEGLWKWTVSWEHLVEKIIEKDIREWTANKALELTGVQDDDLVDAVVQHLRKKGSPQSLVEELEPVLDEEAESLVKKLWRMVIYYSETEKRGIK
ncbi:hypothetical protein CC86DRAFT_383919 [Ophiobolus disseminans]|uniref:PWI domain-containing protein n=1 Tax=Ophiobolus disseminans TaxID=1469910 RepID=A0A6A6ZT57_9PLEO|nr:hypothetical protein CC86DRAFT_383919 [Ophiobolus disseminans]